jgi:hypothetical protein
MKPRASAEDWVGRVRAWRESGQTAGQFSEGKPYSAKLLRWWSSELARRERRTPRVQLTRVVRVETPAEPLVVAVGAARIEVRAGFDRGLLRDVIEALGGGR